MTIFALMPRADLQRWQSARTLADLGTMTALWLEGLVGSQPGYQPRCGPADETTALVPVLATACRAGYVTTASQPSLPLDGAGWDQRAAVHGFAGPVMALRIADAALAAGLEVIATQPGRRPGPADEAVVTRRHGRPVTSFGTMPRRVYCDAVTGWGLCHRDAVTALCQAWQVTIADPQWGRPELVWRTLAAVALAPAGGAR